jgi:hypothetical protein
MYTITEYSIELVSLCLRIIHVSDELLALKVAVAKLCVQKPACGVCNTLHIMASSVSAR